MRSGEPSSIIGKVARILEHQIVPVVDDTAARRALWVTVGLLDNIAVRVEERRNLVLDESQRLGSLLSAAPADLLADVNTPDLEVGTASSALHVETLRRQRRRLVLTLRAVSPSAARERPDVRVWMAACQHQLQHINASQLALMQPTRYGKAAPL